MAGVAILVMAGFFGCAQTGSAKLASEQIVGTYTMRSLFYSRTLQLQRDGSFSFYQLSSARAEKKDEPVRLDESWGVSASWKFMPPDRLELVSASGRDRISIGVKLDEQGQVEMPEIDGLPAQLRSWDTPAAAGSVAK